MRLRLDLPGNSLFADHMTDGLAGLVDHGGAHVGRHFLAGGGDCYHDGAIIICRVELALVDGSGCSVRHHLLNWLPLPVQTEQHLFTVSVQADSPQDLSPLIDGKLHTRVDFDRDNGHRLRQRPGLITNRRQQHDGCSGGSYSPALPDGCWAALREFDFVAYCACPPWRQDLLELSLRSQHDGAASVQLQQNSLAHVNLSLLGLGPLAMTCSGVTYPAIYCFR